MKIINHKMYSNYNSLQVTWNKQSGPFTFMTNYTFSKALGIRGENGFGFGACSRNNALVFEQVQVVREKTG